MTKPKGTGNVLGYNYGFLVYADIKDDPQKTLTVGEGVMGVTVAYFKTWEM